MTSRKTQIIGLLFSLLKKSLWQSDEKIPEKLSEQETSRLFALAERQAVLGLVADVLIHHGMKVPQQWVYESVGVIEQIKYQSRIVNEGIVKLDKLMSNSGICYVIVKGQVVASYYPDPLLRQSGDIDYYCDERNFMLSQDTIRKNWCIEPEKEASELHVHFDYEGVTYEGHFLLTNLYSKKRNKYWRQLLDNDKGTTVNIDGQQIKTLSSTLHTLFVFIHLYCHLLSLGVGLRQFCDLAVMLHYAKNQINMHVLREHLHSLDLERAYRACGSILVDQLGLCEEELGFTLTNKDRGYGRKILDVVMSRGNMGHYEMVNGEWQMVNGAVRSDKISEVRRKISAVGIKLSHFMKFAPLAPGYSCGWLCHEFKRNI